MQGGELAGAYEFLRLMIAEELGWIETVTAYYDDASS
jgi:hypothetical protein